MARLVLFSARISQLINHSAMIPLSSRASPRSNWKRYKSTPLNVSNLSVAYIFLYKANASLAPQRTIKKIIRSECQSIHPRAKRRDTARGEEFEEDPVSIIVVSDFDIIRMDNNSIYTTVCHDQRMPKLLFPSQMAVINFFSKIYRVEYSGRSRVLKLNREEFTRCGRLVGS